MVKSVKAIILASVMVSMSVMLINSCGVSSPTSSTGTASPNMGLNAATGTTPAAPALNPASKSPLPPVLADPAISALPAASIADILKEPHANPNAKGKPVRFDSICGSYLHEYGDLLTGQGYTELGHTYSYVYRLDVYAKSDGWGGWIVISGNPNVLPIWAEQSTVKPHKLDYYSISCGLFPPDFMLPDDFFTGSGFPDGIYIIGGMMYEKGTDPVTGNPTVKPPVPAPVDPVTGKPYNDGYYPPAGETNPPATQPPGTTPPPNATLNSITLSNVPINLAVGANQQMTLTAVYSDGSTQDVTSQSTWNTTMSQYLSVAGGLATGLDGGQTDNITTYFGVAYNGKATSGTITILPMALKSIWILPAAKPISTIYVGETQQFTLIADYGTSTMDVSDTATWSITPTSIATIANGGVVTGADIGQATITATYKGKTAQSAIEIKGVPLTCISVTPPTATIYIHNAPKQAQYTATGSYLNNKKPPSNITQEADWASGDTSIATIIAPGIVKAGTMQGLAYIYAGSTAVNGAYIQSPPAVINVEWYQYTDFLQIDSGWNTDLYANHPLSDRVFLYTLTDTAIQPSVNIYGGTMGSSGCLTTSIAMGFSTIGSYITPKQLNQNMKNPPISMVYKNYYDSSNFVRPATLVDFSSGNITGMRTNAAISEVKTELDNGNIVIANVPYKDSRTDCTHWLIVKKYNGNNYYTYDPTFGDRIITNKQFCGQIWIGTVKK